MLLLLKCNFASIAGNILQEVQNFSPLSLVLMSVFHLYCDAYLQRPVKSIHPIPTVETEDILIDDRYFVFSVCPL